MKINAFPLILRVTAMLLLQHGYAKAQIKSQPNLDEARKAIAASNDIYFQAFAKDDSSIFINRYSADCWIMPPNSPSLCGPDAALLFFKKAYNDTGLRNGKFITVDVYGISNDEVAEIGFWQSFDANNTLFDNGKYLVLWKNTPKGWKMYRDSFNSDRNLK